MVLCQDTDYRDLMCNQCASWDLGLVSGKRLVALVSLGQAPSLASYKPHNEQADRPLHTGPGGALDHYWKSGATRNGQLEG